MPLSYSARCCSLPHCAGSARADTTTARAPPSRDRVVDLDRAAGFAERASIDGQLRWPHLPLDLAFYSTRPFASYWPKGIRMRERAGAPISLLTSDTKTDRAQSVRRDFRLASLRFALLRFALLSSAQDREQPSLLVAPRSLFPWLGLEVATRGALCHLQPQPGAPGSLGAAGW